MIREWFITRSRKHREYHNIERVKAEEDVKNNYNPDGRARLIAMLKDRSKNYKVIAFGL